MIVRLMGEGQYRIDDARLARLNVLDDHATDAIEAGDAAGLARELGEIWELVQREGARLADDHLSPSEAIVPPFDLSLDEARALMSDEGFIPDLPVTH